MAFTNTFYEADSGDVFRIRVEDELLPLVGAPPAGPATTPLYVKVSKTNREFGIRPRFGVYAFSETAPSGRDLTVYKKVPFLTETAFDAAPGTIPFKGETYELVSLNNEDY